MAKIKNRVTDKHTTKPKGVPKHVFNRVYWPYIPIVFIVSVLLTLGAQSGNLQAYMRHPGGRVLAYATSMTISGLLADTNTARQANGAAGLNLNDKLDAAAQAQADDMAARDYWSHYTPDGNPPWVWVTAQGYAYQALAQNLATGFDDEQSVINGWLASPDHRTNMLNPVYKDVGFGFSNSPNYTAAGGGPMTIVVAFYGQPQVLAAATPAAPVSSQTPAPPPVTSSTPTPTPAPSGSAPAVTQSPAVNNTSATANTSLAPTVKQSRIQLALGDSQLTAASTSAGLALALMIGAFWISRHLRALHRFLLRGERYAIRHPITDIGLLVIACLLFILSQTAGLIQ